MLWWNIRRNFRHCLESSRQSLDLLSRTILNQNLQDTSRLRFSFYKYNALLPPRQDGFNHVSSSELPISQLFPRCLFRRRVFLQNLRSALQPTYPAYVFTFEFCGWIADWRCFSWWKAFGSRSCWYVYLFLAPTWEEHGLLGNMWADWQMPYSFLWNSSLEYLVCLPAKRSSPWVELWQRRRYPRGSLLNAYDHDIPKVQALDVMTASVLFQYAWKHRELRLIRNLY